MISRLEVFRRKVIFGACSGKKISEYGAREILYAADDVCFPSDLCSYDQGERWFSQHHGAHSTIWFKGRCNSAQIGLAWGMALRLGDNSSFIMPRKGLKALVLQDSTFLIVA